MQNENIPRMRGDEREPESERGKTAKPRRRRAACRVERVFQAVDERGQKTRARLAKRIAKESARDRETADNLRLNRARSSCQSW